MIIDICLLLFVFAGFWLGYAKGIVGTLISVLAYIVALLITLKFSPWLTDFLIRTFGMGKMFALIFGTMAFLILLIFLFQWLIKRGDNYLQKRNLSTSSKIFGGLVMVFIGMIMYSFILWPINAFGILGEKAKTGSISYHTLERIPGKAKSLTEKLKPLFSRYWELMQETIQENKSGTTG